DNPLTNHNNRRTRDQTGQRYSMWFGIKRVFLGTFLIALLSGVLLVSDWHQRKVGAQKIPRLAILVYASQPVLLQGLEGALEALKDNGFVDGQNLVLRQYNAEGDIASVNPTARQVTCGEIDVV